MGQRDIRRLLASGAMAVLQAVERFGTPHNSWLISMLERKPRMLVAIAMAKKWPVVFGRRDEAEDSHGLVHEGSSSQ